MNPIEKYNQRARKINSLLCVGLDADFVQHNLNLINILSKRQMNTLPPLSQTSLFMKRGG